jgi:hypothetical protein
MTAENPATVVDTADIDRYCREYEAKRQEIEASSADLATKKALLLNLIETYGYVPPNAEKSRRLDGVEMVATMTVGSSVEVKSDPVTKLQLRLSHFKKPRVFKQLFSKTIKYSLVKDASTSLKLAIQTLPAEAQAEILVLFTSCFEVNTNTPSLKVETVAVIKAKEEKAAKKAATKKAVRG